MACTGSVIRRVEDIGDIDTASISRSVFVTGFRPTTTPEDLIIQFQRSKNGGGDIERVILSKKGTAVITFDDPKVFSSVLQHEQVLGGQFLTVIPFLDTLLSKNHPDYFEVFKEVSARLCLKFVDFLSRKKNRALLSDIEAKTGVKWTESSERIVFSGTFKQVEEAQKLLQENSANQSESCLAHSIISHGPEANFLTREQVARSVVVWNIASSTQDVDIIIHFQRAKYGGGGISHLHIPDKGTAVVTFDENEVATRVLKRPHKLHGSELKLHRFTPTEAPQVFEVVSAELCSNFVDNLSRKLARSALRYIGASTGVGWIETQETFIVSGTCEQVKEAYVNFVKQGVTSASDLQWLINQEKQIEDMRSSLSAASHHLEKVNEEKTVLEERLTSLQFVLEGERNSHLEEVNQQKEAVEARVRGLEQQLEGERNSHLTTERQLRSALSLAEESLAEFRRQQSCDWIIQREEVVISEQILGKGAWGNVRTGIFRGCEVAVKEIHELILSDYNRRLFEREMTIASRCRHPNLLQFIGATNDEVSPLFVTELLDASLRQVLLQRELCNHEKVSLALDVAKGLNYLHLSRPTPIMHRDISSANVLLWKRGDSWKAKLSDYGSANFLRESMTVNAGALIYSAPEAFSPRQTTKVDVYSFGVLLCEMCIREQPDPRDLHNQIARARGTLQGLIQRCVQRDPEARPTMSEVILELKQHM